SYSLSISSIVVHTRVSTKSDHGAMMAVSLGSSNMTPPSSAMPSPPLPPPRSSSLSPGSSGQQSQGTTGRSRSSRKGQHGHREVRFGNYILGQTLGEGEFGKVKLGW